MVATPSPTGRNMGPIIWNVVINVHLLLSCPSPHRTSCSFNNQFQATAAPLSADNYFTLVATPTYMGRSPHPTSSHPTSSHPTPPHPTPNQSLAVKNGISDQVKIQTWQIQVWSLASTHYLTQPTFSDVSCLTHQLLLMWPAAGRENHMRL